MEKKIDINSMFHHKNLVGKLQVIPDVVSYITPWWEADRLTEAILKFYKNRKTKIKITDADACIGGNTTSFWRSGKMLVNSIELDKERCEVLKNNIKAYGFPTNRVYCGNYFDYATKLKQDCYFFDPPWGGGGYKENKKMDLFLNNSKGEPVNIVDIIHDIFINKRANLVVLRVPYNYNFDSFNKIKCLNFRQKYFKRKGVVNNVILFITRKK